MEQATYKQITFMKKKGIENAEELTKAEATIVIGKLIDELKGEEPEVVEPNEVLKPETIKFMNKAAPKSNGFHLTVEQCRSNALASALDWSERFETEQFKTIDQIMERAKHFEQYILTGE